MMDKRITVNGRAKLADVARVAGVSTATVSRVLSQPEVVAEATRVAVIEAVAATGYRINQAARNLRMQRTGCVVALLPNMGNPFFAKILEGMGRELAANGYDLLVSDTQDKTGRHVGLHRFLDRSRADGIILMDGLVPQDGLNDPDAPPVITACEWIEDADLPRVMLDNTEGGRMAVTHLRDLGHRRIGLIGGPPVNVLHKARLQGVQQAAGDAELTVFDGDFTMQSGQAAAQAWLTLPSERRPTAVFAFSDEMACAFIASLHRAGVLVPRDLSVIGFDDIEMASLLAPALTTIRQPKRELGKQAARVILRRIAGDEVQPMVSLSPLLMVRETTAPLQLDPAG